MQSAADFLDQPQQSAAAFLDQDTAPEGVVPASQGGSFWGNSIALAKNDINSLLNYPSEVGKAESAGAANAVDFIKNMIPGVANTKPETPAQNQFAKDYQSKNPDADLLSEGHAAFNEGVANSPYGQAMGALTAFPPFAMVAPIANKAIDMLGNIAKDVGGSKEEFQNTVNTAMMASPLLHFMKPAPAPETMPPTLKTGAAGEPLLVAPSAYAKAMDIIGNVKPDLTDDIAKMDAAQKTGNPSTLLDQNPDDTNLKGLAQVTSNASPSATKMSSEVTARSADLGDNIDNLLKSNFGDYNATKANAKAQMTASRPAYEKAYEGGSVAPLETQFQGEMQRTNGNLNDAAAKLQEAKNQMTIAEAKATQTGGNVYAESVAKQGKTAAQNAIDQAQKNYDTAQQEHQNSMDMLRQAQSDRANGVKGGVWSPVIGQALQFPEVQAGIKEGLTQERLNAFGENRPFNATEYAITGKDANGAPVVSSVPNMKLLDTAKTGLDSMIEGEKKDGGGFTKKGVGLIKTKNRILSEMDAINPDYATARKTYGDPASEAQHLEMGRDFENMDDADIAEIMAKATPRNQAAFMQGAGKYLSDAVDKATQGENNAVNAPLALKKLLNTDTLNKLRPAFNNDVKFNSFVDNLTRLSNESLASKTLNYGKEGAARAEAESQINKTGGLGLTNIIKAALSHKETAAKVGLGAINKIQGDIPKDVSTVITRILTTKDPNVLRYVHQYNMTKPPSAGIPARIGGAVAGQMANPLALPGIAVNQVQATSRAQP